MALRAVSPSLTVAVNRQGSGKGQRGKWLDCFRFIASIAPMTGPACDMRRGPAVVRGRRMARTKRWRDGAWSGCGVEEEQASLAPFLLGWPLFFFSFFSLFQVLRRRHSHCALAAKCLELGRSIRYPSPFTSKRWTKGMPSIARHDARLTRTCSPWRRLVFRPLSMKGA